VYEYAYIKLANFKAKNAYKKFEKNKINLNKKSEGSLLLDITN
jgi:hypothetical protein